MNIRVGVYLVEPNVVGGIKTYAGKHYWCYNLQSGNKGQSERQNEWEHYTNEIPTAGDTITMQVRRDGTLSFYRNGIALGNAFKNSRLTLDNLYPWVFIADERDAVEVLHGS